MKKIMRLTVCMLWITACNNSGKTVSVPDLPYLKADTLNVFKVGDRFILATSTNSCCMYCWQNNDTLQEAGPASFLVKYIETIEDPSDPDCAGCSSFFYDIYECVVPGSDTLRYAVIPMGSLDGSSRCADLNTNELDISYFRKYIINVTN
jgi:hypothetical protein